MAAPLARERLVVLRGAPSGDAEADDGLAAGVVEELLHWPGEVEAARVDRDDLGAARAEEKRVRPAESITGTSDDGNLICK